jgi:D,D-heptose 1,7-bisphosphate phosphatase
MQKAVFLDLNGTLVLPVKVEMPSEYQPIAGSIESVRLLNEAGFLCPVITVQSGISKGRYTEAKFMDWFADLQRTWAAQGALLCGVYLCPHSGSADCDCHKPEPKLYLDAARDHNIDCLQSYVVGDTLGDVRAGAAIGAKSAFVQTGWADRYLPQHAGEAHYVGADLLAVAHWIIADSAK